MFVHTQAVVCFEKQEDAEKLKSLKNFDIKEVTVSVVNEKVTLFSLEKYINITALLWQNDQ